MKSLTSALVLIALLGAQQEATAVKLTTQFSDDLMKQLAEDMQKDSETSEAES